MRYSLMVFLVMLNLWDIVAQGAKQEVELLLKNGNILNGYVLVEDLPEHLSLFTSDTDSLKIPFTQIKNIRYARIGDSHGRNFKNVIFSVTEVGMLFGNVSEDNNVSSSMTVQTTCGYGFHRLLKIGVGAGYDQYEDAYTLPVYLSIRGDVLNRKISPVYFLNAGYAAAWGEESEWQSWADMEGGKMIDAGIGIRFASTDGYRILVSLGYKIQDLTYTQLNWEGQVSSVTERENRRLRLSIGVGF